MPRTIDRHIRVTPEQWRRIENAAQSSNLTANRLVIELAIEALDHREWPRTDHETRLLRSSMFTAQAIARDMIAAGPDGRHHAGPLRVSTSSHPPAPASRCSRQFGAGNDHRRRERVAIAAVR